MTTYTPNLNLAKPVDGDTNWKAEINANWDKLDTQENAPYYGELSRYSATQIKLSGRDNTPQFVEVNGSSIDISTAKTVNVGTSSDNLIEGGSPSASTLYNIYLSDSGTLQLSVTSPNSNGYRTGDSNNRFVGAVYLDADTEVAEEYNLCGIMQKYRSYESPSEIVRTTGDSDNYDMLVFENVVLLENTNILAMASVNMEQEDMGLLYTQLYIDSSSDKISSEISIGNNVTHTCPLRIAYISDSIQTKDIHCQYLYLSGSTVRIWSDSKLEIIRVTSRDGK